MDPFFSVIIPTYNRAHLIPAAIESVLKQTFSHFELLIVDDGSTDHTKQVVAQYADSRIRYIFQQNAERCAARNNGINNAKGLYICFLDSDDYYLPNRLEMLHQSVQQQLLPEAVFYTGVKFENGTQPYCWEMKWHSENIFDHLALAVIHSQQTCIHRNILQHYHYDTAYHIGEDLELWLRIAEKYRFVPLTGQQTIVIIEHEERTVNIKRYNFYIHQMQMYRSIFAPPHPGSKISSALKKQMLSDCYFGMAKYAIYTNDRISALKNLFCTLITDIRNKQFKFRLNVLLSYMLNKNKAKKLIEG